MDIGELFSNITHGLMVLDSSTLDQDGMIRVVHFVGYWAEPTEDDILRVWKRLAEDPDFEWRDEMENLEILRATPEVIEHYKQQAKEDGL